MDERTRQRRRRGRAREPAAPATRSADYRHLVSPLALARGYSDDQIAQIHATALTVLQELGVRVNHDGARDLLARAGAAVTGQICIITPFTLSGAMAPVTIPGALVQQHAELLAGLVLTQTVRPGAPVVYGGFTSNVDMKSGAPAFGTPEYVRACWGTGQLARLVGLPWRSSASCVSNTPDAQAIWETQMSLWGALTGGANIVIHAAGWLEGGLSASYEKFILDIEQLQHMAEVMQPVHWDDGELALEALREVGSGGHFFGTEHTMKRYRTAYYAPYVSDWSNFGQWQEAGARTATERAHDLWQQVLAEFRPPEVDPGTVEAIDAFIARRVEEGGTDPVS